MTAAKSRHTCQYLLNHTNIGCLKGTHVHLRAPLVLYQNVRAYSKTQVNFARKNERSRVYLAPQKGPVFEREGYLLDDAIRCLRAYSLFEAETVDVVLKLDMGKKETRIQSIQGILQLPKPMTPQQTILVFAEGEAADQARQAGAAIVGGTELIKQVEKGELEFDHCLSTLDFLPKIKHLPKILRAKMPHPRRGTATDDILGALKLYSQGEKYSADRTGLLRKTIAWTSFSNKEIRGNVMELMKGVDSFKTMDTGDFFKHVSIVIPPGPTVNLLLEDVIAFVDKRKKR